ncbi:MAG: valine--tRNA ligase [Parcubacteria group bacterium]|nr:valine--tRNA ligase [Parcubacteria group bacterium]
MEKPDMPKAYEAKDYEDAIYASWEQSGFFNPDTQDGDPYVIMMPPPNVTGILHLGHALENTLMDTMARFQRLRGKSVLLVPGTDHAAIATQAKVEKMLIDEGHENPREEFGRDGLVEKIRVFADESMATILGQIRKMGTSCDWSRLAYTFDEPRNKAVNELFTRMYNDGLIYRGYRVVNWSVKGQSTQSDDEIEHVEREAKLYTFKYSKDFPITIATTRPETKLGDTAVAVHPTDERYKSFIGQTFTVDVGAKNPLEIKIIADEEVDPAFGTGALGVTPAHSQIDFLMYEKQKAQGNPIEIIPVIGKDGNMTEEAGSYAGMSVEDARAKFVEWLSSEGLLEKEEEIMQNVGTSDRYGDVIEALPMTQWWLDMNKEIPGRGKSLRLLMREAVTTGLNGDQSQKVTITPDRFTKLYLDRVDSLRDWCLSRQIWWGHQIPVWYKGDEVFVGTEAPEGDGWQRDPDTLDTWFSSGSWTFSTLGWPDKTKDLEKFHPTAWMQMGYEILYLWLMRMILMSTYSQEEIPFKDAYIHGMLRDKDGKKFSKSAGNGIDPIDVIQEVGADALRISLLLGISPGNDSRFYPEKLEGGRNFVNKLWNISRFVLGQVEVVGHVAETDLSPQTLADRWILSRFHTLQSEVTDHLEAFEFSQAGEKLRNFTWGEFADWYLEIAKVQDGKSTQDILLYILERLLTYWHPFMPFVTEQIWKQIDPETMLMIHEWPMAAQDHLDKEAEAEFEKTQEIIAAIRNLRSEYNVAPKTLVNVVLTGVESLDSQRDVMCGLGRVQTLTFGSKPEGEIATAVVGVIQVHVSLEGLVDKKVEAVRLTRERDMTAAYCTSLTEKLANDTFTSKAPEKIVNTMKQNLDEAKAKLTLLEDQLNAL